MGGGRRTPVRWLRILFLLLLVAACGETGGTDPLADPSRTRTVTVTLSVLDERDPTGTRVVLSGYGEAMAGSFAVTVLDTGDEGIGVDCGAASAAASSVADTIGSEIGECRPVTEDRPFAAETVILAAPGATFDVSLLPDLDYEIGASAEVVPGDDGCHWNAATTLEPGAASVSLHLDSNGCD